MRKSYHEHRETLDMPLPSGSVRSSPSYLVGRHDAMQRDADEIARARKRSPAFPTLDEAARRKRHRREAFLARCFLLLTVVGVMGAVSSHSVDGVLIGSIITAVGGLGFAATCIMSGQHSERDNGGY